MRLLLLPSALLLVLSLSLSGCNMGSGGGDTVMQEGGSSKKCKMDVAAGVETIAGETDPRVKVSLQCTKLASGEPQRLTGCGVQSAADVQCPGGWDVDQSAVSSFEPVTCSLADAAQVRGLCRKKAVALVEFAQTPGGATREEGDTGEVYDMRGGFKIVDTTKISPEGLRAAKLAGQKWLGEKAPHSITQEEEVENSPGTSSGDEEDQDYADDRLESFQAGEADEPAKTGTEQATKAPEPSAKGQAWLHSMVQHSLSDDAKSSGDDDDGKKPEATARESTADDDQDKEGDDDEDYADKPELIRLRARLAKVYKGNQKK